MQKVIRRTVLAEKQAARRLAKKKDKSTRDWAKLNRNQINYSRKEQVLQIKEARITRREDWELGPLAPRRDVGDSTETYGTISSHRTKGPLLHYDEIKEKLKPVGGRYMNIVPGDRVVLLEGRDKGKIGKIASIDAKRAECVVDGLNLADVTIPTWMISEEEADKRPIRTFPLPISISSVRLVFPLTNEEGVTRDVIVKKIVNSKIWHDRHAGTVSWTRRIPGLDVVIPWPKKEPKEHKDFPNDTLRLDVETRTFVPTLLRPPMPGSVIDELRNKFSVFRTRHDPEYLEAKRQEDIAVEEKKKTAELMRTPLREANRKQRKLRKAKGKGKLTPEMLERIGQVIAKKRKLALDVVGASQEEAVPEPVAA